jgi:D-beta-D-heptose 7-phosphate kinase/D-beta-D-heptose 1-phosphate adenosyltransferase
VAAPLARKALASLRALRRSRFLAIGDLMLDTYVYGEAKRLSPEAPVPVVRVTRRRTMPGGMGNVVMNLKDLGARPHALALVGGDLAGDTLKGLLAGALGEGGLTILVDPDRPTTEKTRIIAGIQQVVRYDEESQERVSRATEEAYSRQARRLLEEADALSVSDYGKGLLTPRLTQLLIKAAREGGVPVVVDPKGSDWSPYRGATLITPNRQELSLALGKDIAHSPGDTLAMGAMRLIDRHKIANILVTRSEDGMTLVSEDGTVWHLPSDAKAVYDVSGAGDTVVAAMAAAMGVGLPLLEGAMLATLAAGVVVGKVGTATASPQEIWRSQGLTPPKNA